MHRTIQLAVPLRRGVDSTSHLFLMGDVGGLIADRATVSGQRLDLRDCARQAIGVAADDHDGGPGRDQPGGHAFTDSTAAAGDQIRPVFES